MRLRTRDKVARLRGFWPNSPDEMTLDAKASVAPRPIKSPCSREFYKAARHSGTRRLSEIELIVLHTEEAPTARAAARYFKSPDAAGSAHLCVDDKICYRCLANEDVPWAAPGANTNGFHIEQAGYARWSTVVWKKHVMTLQRAAYKTAFHCRLFGIPVRFVDWRKLRAGASGITTHRQVSRAFGGSHQDPGPFWPRALFMWHCRRYYKQLTANDRR
jgi:N-acetylmuramoyl-L-alanine amidase